LQKRSGRFPHELDRVVCRLLSLSPAALLAEGAHDQLRGPKPRSSAASPPATFDTISSSIM
jgi:hypothetical protein